MSNSKVLSIDEILELDKKDSELAYNEAHLWELKNGKSFPWPKVKFSPKETYIHPDFGKVPYINGRCG